MTVHYSGQGRTHEYLCNRLLSDYGGERCQHLSGMALDTVVTQQVLAALQPAALELSLQAATQLEQERAQLNQIWQQKLERTAFEAERAGRHYRLVEPENRLVARQLAREWEEKLAQQQQLQEDYQRFCAQQPQQLSPGQREAIQQLAYEIPTLWSAPTTTSAQRKEIVRQLIHRIIVQVHGHSERVTLTIEWTGGSMTQHQATRPVAKWEQLSYYPQLCEQLRTLVATGLTAAQIAYQLNQEGFRPPKYCTQFERPSVLELMQRLGIYQRRPKGIDKGPLAADEWWLPDLARHLKIPNTTLYAWVKRGWVKARQQQTSPYRLIVWADEAELGRLNQFRQSSLSDRLRQQWLEKQLL
ncbi:hypothetical protein BV378_24310 [Nostoc sp. RF31YmG]|nr:hypothetical protein BV378_24310 [Nostoc sp. RF31YmG]